MEISKLKKELIEQKKSKFKGNVYHYSQVNFAYNSNKIEGGLLTGDETEEIFENNSFILKSEYAVKLDDVFEMKNHFQLFDYMIDTIDEPLSKKMIINMNKILKRNTSDEENPRYNVTQTSSLENVEKDIDELLENYHNLKKVTLEDIIEFHVRFERIHPFGDGNGRVGRMIMFRECLRNDIIPFIVLDSDKPYYIRGLREYKNDKMFLIDTIKNEQDIYERVCEELLDFELPDN